jgi:hypothetical protein
LDAIGFLRLPPPRRPPVGRRPVPITERSALRCVATFHPRDIGLACFSIVTGSGDPERERLWNEYVERYHELGYGISLGAHVKYFVMLGEEPIACLAFGGAAWRVEARDRWIGWSCERRERNLHYVVNNTRFLIFPWIEVRNLASRLLALAARRVREDWVRLYAYRPLLLETFVNCERHAGTCYRAANWRLLGTTKGRGKLDRHFKAKEPKKAVWVWWGKLLHRMLIEEAAIAGAEHDDDRKDSGAAPRTSGLRLRPAVDAGASLGEPRIDGSAVRAG